jgi:hypothetical protein
MCVHESGFSVHVLRPPVALYCVFFTQVLRQANLRTLSLNAGHHPLSALDA